MSGQNTILKEYADSLTSYYENEQSLQICYPMFYQGEARQRYSNGWIKENNIHFFKDTPNKISYNRWFLSEYGYISALAFSPNGNYLIVGHSSGLIQVKSLYHFISR